MGSVDVVGTGGGDVEEANDDVVSDEVGVVAVELVFSGLPIAFFLAADTAVGDADDAARLGAPKNDVKEACVDPVLRRLGEREEDMSK